MNTYELERKLNDKVDGWRFHDLESQVITLRHQNQQLTVDLRDIQYKYNNLAESLRQTIELIANKQLFELDYNSLQNLKQQL